MSNLTDRTDDIRIVNAPMEFKASEMWRDSMEQLEVFIDQLVRQRFIPIEDYGHLAIKERWEPTLESLALGDKVQLLKLCPSEPTNDLNPVLPALTLSQLTKYFLTFSRKVSYDWYYEKCESGINDYNEIRERLLDNEHLELPELKVPTYDESKVLPFVKEAVEAFTKWRDDIYDPETQIIKELPMRGMVDVSYSKHSSGGRRILISIDEADGTPKAPEITDNDLADVYLTDELAEKLREIGRKYDIEGAWEKSQVALSAMSDKFDSKD